MATAPRTLKMAVLVLLVLGVLLSACQSGLTVGLDTPFGDGDLSLNGGLTDGNGDRGNSRDAGTPLQLDNPIVLLALVILGLAALVAIAR